MAHGWKEWFLRFFSGARRFFQATDVFRSHVACVLNHENERDFRRTYTHSSCSRCPNRMVDLSFEVTGKSVVESNTFVLVNSVEAARRLEVEQKLDFLAILILD